MSFNRLRELMPRVAEAGDNVEGVLLRVQVLVSSMSIRYKIAGALVAVLCLAIASLGFVSFRSQKRTLSDEMRLRGEVLGRQLAASAKTAMLTQEDLTVYATIKDVAKMPDVVYAFVQDRSGKVFAHSDLALKGRVLNGDIDRVALDADQMIAQRGWNNGIWVLDAAVPIVSKLGEKTIRIGTARVGLSEEALLSAIRRQKVSFLLITSAFVAFGLVISFALGKVLTRQIFVLMTGMKVVSEGNLNHLVSVEAKDEIGRLAETFNQMILNLREKLHMERYLSSSTMKVVKRFRDAEQMRLGGERRHVAVLFSDIRGFTSFTEALDPAEVVGLLNIYLNLQAEVVYQRGGVVDKFVGDEVMALFTEGEAECQAILAAQEINNFVESLNDARAGAGKKTLTVGIGVNAGEVILGNMGSERQMNYTAIGDPINTAARLCSAAKAGQVIVSKHVAEATGERCKWKKLDPIQVKGKKEPLLIFGLLDVPGSARRDMRKRVDRDASYRLAGTTQPYNARLLDLSRGGCRLQAAFPLALGGEIEVVLPSEIGDGLQARGVVRHIHPRDRGFHVGLRFEALDPDVQSRITEWVHQVDSQITVAAAETIAS